MKKEKERFRNHISIVLEQFGSFFYIVLIMVVSGLAQNLERLKSEDFQFLFTDRAFIGALVCLFVILLLIGRNLFVWAKTYISVQDQAIVIECNTLNKRKHTIGIKNISNINTEQNLFEMLIGTYKVKLDTNSLSTADKTDVKIVLKKKEALRFCEQITQMLLQYQNPDMEEATVQEQGKKEEILYDITTDLAGLCVHGLFSISILSLFLTIAGAVGAVAVIIGIIREPGGVQTILGAFASILIAASVFFSAFWDTIKGFIQYYDFRAKRQNDKIYLCYGLLKKVSYTIPVDKIQALKIHQTMLARIAGRYMVEVVNVGMNDEAGQKAFLVLYSTKEQLKDKIHYLLPEFRDAVDLEIKRQPRTVWAAWLFPFSIFIVCTAAVCMTCIAYRPAYALWLLGAEAGILVTAVLCMFLKYRTAGIGMDSMFLKICGGYAGRHYLLLRYNRIQYLETSQNFLARICGIEKGELKLLASAAEASQALPYFHSEHTEQIRKRLLSD
ncbi:PH domain-containing protein [Mediterraneibacter sp. ICN-202921]|uniref:PH domain-containing protein n=1 Tax=Mediterraneibacter sp. ICN-202921 TaxID=3134657 RepID=UPI0030BFD9F6